MPTTKDRAVRGDHDLARSRAMDVAYSANELLWALARKKLSEGPDTQDQPKRYVDAAIEEAYDALAEEYRVMPILTHEDWLVGIEAQESDARLDRGGAA